MHKNVKGMVSLVVTATEIIRKYTYSKDDIDSSQDDYPASVDARPPYNHLL